MFTRPIIQMMLIFIAVTSALPANDDASNIANSFFPNRR